IYRSQKQNSTTFRTKQQQTKRILPVDENNQLIKIQHCHVDDCLNVGRNRMRGRGGCFRRGSRHLLLLRFLLIFDLLRLHRRFRLLGSRLRRLLLLGRSDGRLLLHPSPLGGLLLLLPTLNVDIALLGRLRLLALLVLRFFIDLNNLVVVLLLLTLPLLPSLPPLLSLHNANLHHRVVVRRLLLIQGGALLHLLSLSILHLIFLLLHLNRLTRRGLSPHSRRLLDEQRRRHRVGARPACGIGEQLQSRSFRTLWHHGDERAGNMDGHGDGVVAVREQRRDQSTVHERRRGRVTVAECGGADGGAHTRQHRRVNQGARSHKHRLQQERRLVRVVRRKRVLERVEDDRQMRMNMAGCAQCLLHRRQHAVQLGRRGHANQRLTQRLRIACCSPACCTDDVLQQSQRVRPPHRRLHRQAQRVEQLRRHRRTSIRVSHAVREQAHQHCAAVRTQSSNLQLLAVLAHDASQLGGRLRYPLRRRVRRPQLARRTLQYRVSSTTKCLMQQSVQVLVQLRRVQRAEGGEGGERRAHEHRRLERARRLTRGRESGGDATPQRAPLLLRAAWQVFGYQKPSQFLLWPHLSTHLETALQRRFPAFLAH
ncbi:hypothetical protein PFISCL1PPCAC_17807, partial [Pristionchus fissidentatus]